MRNKYTHSDGSLLVKIISKTTRLLPDKQSSFRIWWVQSIVPDWRNNPWTRNEPCRSTQFSRWNREIWVPTSIRWGCSNISQRHGETTYTYAEHSENKTKLIKYQKEYKYSVMEYLGLKKWNDWQAITE